MRRSFRVAVVCLIVAMILPTVALMLRAPEWVKVLQIGLIVLCWIWVAFTRPKPGEEVK